MNDMWSMVETPLAGQSISVGPVLVSLAMKFIAQKKNENFPLAIESMTLFDIVNAKI